MEGGKYISYPKVSVGIPTYNSNGTLEQALRSVLDQQYPNLEIVISDNYSSDVTEELCRQWSKMHPEIKYTRQSQNIGLVKNFEFVLRQSTGEYFMWISDDDTLEPGILKKYTEFLTAHREYALVAGQVLYKLKDNPVYVEKDFSLEQGKPTARVTQYYFKVIYGGLFYGLMPRSLAEKIPLRNRIGDDWHFVATLAYLGKIKNLDVIGYRKNFGGCSRDFKLYAFTIGASWFSASFPHMKIAMDAFLEILVLSPVYSAMPFGKRFVLALSSSLAVFVNYYAQIFPFVLGGKIKRYFQRLTKRWFPGLTVKATLSERSAPR